MEHARKAVPIVVLVALCTAPILAQTEDAPEVLARIGDFNVIPSYIDFTVRNHFAGNLMRQIVRRQVLLQEAKAHGIKVSHQEVTTYVDERKEGFPSEEAFIAHVHEQGLTMKGYRERVHTELLLEKLLDTAADFSDEQIRSYYEETRNEPWPTELEMDILHVMTDSRQDAVSSYRAVLDGTPFSVVARRFNVAQAPAEDGKLGWRSKATMPIEELWEFALPLEEDHLTQPFKIGDYYHMIKLLGKRERPAAGNDELRRTIAAELREQGGIDPEEYMTNLLAKADIEISWEPVAYLDEYYAAIGKPRVEVDGIEIALSPPPYINDQDVLMGPARPLLTAIGASVEWHAGSQTLEAAYGETELKVSVGTDFVSVNGEVHDISVATVRKEGAAFIPIADILDALGLTTQWDGNTRVLSVSTTPAG